MVPSKSSCSSQAWHAWGPTLVRARSIQHSNVMYHVDFLGISRSLYVTHWKRSQPYLLSLFCYFRNTLPTDPRRKSRLCPQRPRKHQCRALAEEGCVWPGVPRGNPAQSAPQCVPRGCSRQAGRYQGVAPDRCASVRLRTARY